MWNPPSDDSETKAQRSSGTGADSENDFNAKQGGQKGEIENQSGGIDSGFMSGPQLSYDSDEEEVDPKQQQDEHKELNIKPVVTDTASGKQDVSDTILDSGIDCGAGLSEKLGDLSLEEKQLNAVTPVKDQDNSDTRNQTEAWQLYFKQDEDGDTQLHIACLTGYADVVSTLVKLSPHPCLLNIQNDNAMSALHFAVLTGQPRLVRILLAGGASPLVRDSNGNTPLHLASSLGDLETIKQLTTPITLAEIQTSKRIQQKFMADFQYEKLPQDLEIRNYDGKRCIHLATENNHMEALRHLVHLGADVNAKEWKSGKAVLHMAIEMRNETLTKFLLTECRSIDLEAETYAGLTAYQMAAMIKLSQLQLDLERHGAEPLIPPDTDDDESDEEEFNDESYRRLSHTNLLHSSNRGDPIHVS